MEGFEYLLRSGEIPVSSDSSKVIDVRQAAVALACASPVLSDAVLAKREVSQLFDRESGPYRRIFNQSTNGLTLHRVVSVVRLVDETLDNHLTDEAYAPGVAVHGRRVIAHIVLNEEPRPRLADPDFPFSKFLAGVPERTLHLLLSLTAHFPENSYPGNVFKNQSRCAQLLRDAGVITKAAEVDER